LIDESTLSCSYRPIYCDVKSQLNILTLFQFNVQITSSEDSNKQLRITVSFPFPISPMLWVWIKSG